MRALRAVQVPMASSHSARLQSRRCLTTSGAVAISLATREIAAAYTPTKHASVKRSMRSGRPE